MTRQVSLDSPANKRKNELKKCFNQFHHLKRSIKYWLPGGLFLIHLFFPSHQFISRVCWPLKIIHSSSRRHLIDECILVSLLVTRGGQRTKVSAARELPGLPVASDNWLVLTYLTIKYLQMPTFFISDFHHSIFHFVFTCMRQVEDVPWARLSITQQFHRLKCSSNNSSWFRWARTD